MRRGIVAIAALAVLTPIPANASGEVTAGFYGVVSPNADYSAVDTVMVCTAQAARTSSTVAVVCSIDDGHADSGVSNTCSAPAPLVACEMHLLGGTLPVTICAVATATLADLTTDTDTHCRTYTAPTS